MRFQAAPTNILPKGCGLPRVNVQPAGIVEVLLISGQVSANKATLLKSNTKMINSLKIFCGT